jgi:hypothetical protein
MLPRTLLFKFAALIFVAIMLVALPASSYAAQVDTWQPSQPPAGMGSVVFINHTGQGAALTVDLAGTLYNVPDKANDIPGRVQVNLPPGTYAFTADAFNFATSRTVEVKAGQVIGLNFMGVGSELVVLNSSEATDENAHDSRIFKITGLGVVFDDITNQTQS